jgi:phenylacetate-CoA ligase
MLIIRGVNVYPSQIESVLARVEGLSPHYRIVVSREGALDAIEVQPEVDGAVAVALRQGELSDEVLAGHEVLRALRARVATLLHETIGVSMRVTLLPPGRAPRSEGGKLNRVEDRRPR